MASNFKFDTLKTRQREIRESLPDSISLRIHRSLSWLQRSEQEADDNDAQFIFLWIAFNSAYASEIHDMKSFSERRAQFIFIKRLLDSDKDKLLYNIVWAEFSKSIRLLIDNQYIYQPFWDYQKGNLTEAEWQSRFKEDNASAKRALGQMNTKKILAIVFDRLYVLRNQLIHGGATWNSKVNRDQVRDGANILGRLVPTIIHLMMESGNEVWGDAAFPVIE